MLKLTSMFVNLITLILALSLPLLPTQADADELKSYIDSKENKPMSRGEMIGHTINNEQPIRIFQDSNAHVMFSAIIAVRNKNWFPESTQVDEIRFVDSNKLGRHNGVRVLFPTQSEIEAGKGIRIEIPNFHAPSKKVMDGKLVSLDLMKAIKLIDDQRKSSEKVARESLTVLAKDCDKKPGQPECVNWRKKVRLIFSGEAVKPLESDAKYCDVRFNVGLKSEETNPKKSGSFASGAPQFSQKNLDKLNVEKLAGPVLDRLQALEERFGYKIGLDGFIDSDDVFHPLSEYSSMASEFSDSLGLSTMELWDITAIQEAMYRARSSLTEETAHGYRYDSETKSWKRWSYATEGGGYTTGCCWNIASQFIVCPCNN